MQPHDYNIAFINANMKTPKNLKSVKNEGDFILKSVIFTCIFILKSVNALI